MTIIKYINQKFMHLLHVNFLMSMIFQGTRLKADLYPQKYLFVTGLRFRQ